MDYAFQIVISFQALNFPMPSNVSLVILYLADLVQFNVFPNDRILNYCLHFTDTESIGIGFEFTWDVQQTANSLQGFKVPNDGPCFYAVFALRACLFAEEALHNF
jgi:hypothetical protein